MSICYFSLDVVGPRGIAAIRTGRICPSTLIVREHGIKHSKAAMIKVMLSLLSNKLLRTSIYSSTSTFVVITFSCTSQIGWRWVVGRTFRLLFCGLVHFQNEGNAVGHSALVLLLIQLCFKGLKEMEGKEVEKGLRSRSRGGVLVMSLL